MTNSTWTTTAGSMFNMAASPVRRAMVAPLEDQARVTFRQLDVDLTAHVPVARWLLRLRPGSGPQLPHFDQTCSTNAMNRWAVLVYLTHGPGTHVWVGDDIVQARLFFDTVSTTNEQRTLARQHVVSSNFECARVVPCQMLCARGDFLHYGPYNDMTDDRWAYYCLFSKDLDVPDQDAHQRFPLGYNVKMRS